MENKRNPFINTKIATYVVGYTLTSFVLVFIFVTWESFIHLLVQTFPGLESVFAPKNGIGPVIKISLLIIWGVISFIISYVYLDTKFMGIFNRMDQIFKDMLHNHDLKLSFRKGDAFYFVADSFNAMRTSFQNKIESRQIFLDQLTEAVHKLENHPSSEDIDVLVQNIDAELSK